MAKTLKLETVLPVAKTEPICTLVGGKPVTLKRIRAVAHRMIPGFDSVEARRGKLGCFDVLGTHKLASRRKLLPGPESSAWVVRQWMERAPGYGTDVRAALAAARAHCDVALDIIRSNPRNSDIPVDRVTGELIANAMLRKGAPIDPTVNAVTATAWACLSLGMLPEWVLNAPIPDALREDGLADLLLRYSDEPITPKATRKPGTRPKSKRTPKSDPTPSDAAPMNVDIPTSIPADPTVA